MSEPSKKSSLSSEKLENLLVFAERLRLQAEEFQETVEEEFRTVCAAHRRVAYPSGEKAGSWKMNGRR
jgi:hypothetical protein